LPPPKFGMGFLLCLVVVRLRICAPIVLLCWLRTVWIRESAVGCLSKSVMSSR
jgi:hypothetical protein